MTEPDPSKPPVLGYFNPRTVSGRAVLAKVAVGLAIGSVPASVCCLFSIPLALSAIVVGAIAVRSIDEYAEPLAHRRAQAAIFLGFLMLLIGCGLSLSFDRVERWIHI